MAHEVSKGGACLLEKAVSRGRSSSGDHQATEFPQPRGSGRGISCPWPPSLLIPLSS